MEPDPDNPPQGSGPAAAPTAATVGAAGLSTYDHAMNARLTTPVVILILGLAAIVATLIYFGKDAAALVGFLNTLGIAYAIVQNESIRTQTNGTLHRTMSIVERVVPGGDGSAVPAGRPGGQETDSGA